MKYFLFFSFIFFFSFLKSQWVYKKIDNHLDDAYRIAYCKSGKAILKLENVNGEVAFYLSGGYFCEDDLTVDIAFIDTKSQTQKYHLNCKKSTDSKTVFLTDDLSESELIRSFHTSKKVIIRVNESYCDDELYEFSMVGSTSAFNFIKNEKSKPENQLDKQSNQLTIDKLIIKKDSLYNDTRLSLLSAKDSLYSYFINVKQLTYTFLPHLPLIAEPIASSLQISMIEPHFLIWVLEESEDYTKVIIDNRRGKFYLGYVSSIYLASSTPE